MNKEETGEGVSAVGRGRGRGRARAMVSDEPAPAPGASTTTSIHIGRGRANIGRGRGEAVPAAVASISEKPHRGSPPPEDGSSSEVTAKMAALESISLAPRPGYGTWGRKYRMLTNHFEISISSDALTVYQYHIDISTCDVILNSEGRLIKLLTRNDNREIFWKCFFENKDDLGLSARDDLFKVAYDWVNTCLTLNPLTCNNQRITQKTYELEVSIPKKDRPLRVRVSIKSAGQILVDFRQVANLNLLERSCTPIQVIDILLRQNRSCPYSECATMYYPFKNWSIYLIPNTGNTPSGTYLGGGRELWKGLFTASHVADDNRAMVNMDIDYTAFYKSSLIDEQGGIINYSIIQFLCDVLNDDEHQGKEIYKPSQLREDSNIPQAQQRTFEHAIADLKICVDYHQLNCPVNEIREYRVHCLDKSAADCIFTKSDGTQLSVAEYYKETYGPLKYPRMFTLKCGPRKKPNVPINPRRYVNFPIERCYLAPKQKVLKKLSEHDTTLIIKTTCMPPVYRKEAIERLINDTRFDEDPFLTNFGIHLNPKMVSIDGRVLPHPSLVYGGNRTVQIQNGVWRTGQGTQFYIPSEARGVAAVAFSRAPDNAKNFVEQLMNCCRQYGMKVPNVEDVVFHLEKDASPQRVEIAFRKVFEIMKQQNKECQLIIVLLQQKGTPLYADVKYIAEIRMGLMTQCVVNKTVSTFTHDILMNLAYKINMKLGGTNSTISAREQFVQCFFKEPTLVLGIDVTHPGPTERKKPSVACVTGSVDLYQERYYVSTKIQKERSESLVYLVDKVKERILAFYKSTREKPKRILVYRDGVSEGQFQMVLREELYGIHQACRMSDHEYRPKITFVIVQKRHHTRFFPENPRDGCGKHHNVYPGTVVDNGIVPSNDFVFYLCSHAGIQGTSRPTRYTVLHDDNNFSADDLQSISFYLCHCFSRCTRSVSIPAPVYYAHLACTRARSYLQACIGDTLSDTASTLSGDMSFTTSLSEEELTAATTVVDSIQKTMYFT